MRLNLFLAPVVFLIARITAADPAYRVQDAIAPDPDDRPLAIRIWSPASLSEDSRLPLIVISHGSGGSITGHADTAEALAAAGFVAVAVAHTGDNYKDQSYVGRGLSLVVRPRQISRVIDYMLMAWDERAHIDPARIGMFGHSAGGFTALVIAGGVPDMTTGAAHCRARPAAWDCEYLRRHGFDWATAPRFPPSAWHHDERVRAAVVAAPAVGYAFEPDGLARVRIPIQLWAAGHDAIVEDSPAIIRRLLPRAPEYHLVAGAGHLSFIAPCSTAEAVGAAARSRTLGVLDYCADPRGFDRTAFHRAFNADVIAFFSKNLPARGERAPRP